MRKVMTTLQQLFDKIECLKARQFINIQQFSSIINIPFNNFCLDSRKIQSDDVFVLLKSQTPNSHLDYEKITSYIHQVADKAAFILSEINLTEFSSNLTLPIIYLPNIRQFLGSLIQENLQLIDPVSLPTVIAVTGTNGKTTVSQLIAQLINQTGQKTAIMGTAGNGILPNLQPASHTTGDVLMVQSFLHEMAKQQVTTLAIEASSHGLHQYRLQAMPIKVAVYTNLSRDHLDYHTDMADYAKAKATVFDRQNFPMLTHAIINADDEFSSIMQQQANLSDLTIWTYSLVDEQADFFARRIEPSLTGVDLTIQTPNGEINVQSPLLGRFNVANLLASIASAMALNMTLPDIVQAVVQLQGATGRMQHIQSKKGCFIVDYAHTPDALTQVLTSLKPHCDGQLWAIFGCGGDRDKGKRPLMTQSALAIADKIILTSDNPRSEDPIAILNDMQQDMNQDDHDKTHIEPNRKTAIEYAVQHACADDIVVIAGKGHETYQEIQGIRYDFDDVQVVRTALQNYQK